MTAREIVRGTIRFEGPERRPYSLTDTYGSDFGSVSMNPSVDSRPPRGRDEWGAVWENIGVSHLGEVRQPALSDWSEFENLHIPEIADPARWTSVDSARKRAGERFLIASGVSLYERCHFIRGLENTWIDIYESADKLEQLIDVLVDMNLYAISRYAEAGADAIMWPDDWGLQNRLMISPEAFREIWKPRYRRVYDAAHKAGMFTFLHSCGDITEILDDLIEIGLDVIQMDQQENMGVERLGSEFGGRITFWCPVDIQNTMVAGSLQEIRDYARRLVDNLGRETGGFIAKWYSDPAGAGHTEEAIEAMCDEFFSLCWGRE